MPFFTWALFPLALSACGGGGDDGDNAATAGDLEPSTEISAERGQMVFNRCRACHAVEAGKSNAAGPNLNGLFGSKAGTKADYGYSPALMKSGIVWNAETLDAYIKKPQAAVAGTRMAFAGIANDAERASLIKYLEEATK